MKKLLLLGGDATLLPVIEAAHKRGYYVITCDYLPDNIAHKYSDEYINFSTTDKDGILEWAKNNFIDGVLTFTDSGVIAAAYICEALNLQQIAPYSTIEIMQHKDRFRAFLNKIGANVPSFSQYNSWNCVAVENYPVMVKPVDAAGSKGVTKVKSADQLRNAYEYADSFSACHRVIIEDYIEPRGAQIHGDCFIQNGKVIFACLGDHHFDKGINGLIPVSTTWPSMHPEDDIQKVLMQIQLFVSKVGFKTGCINIECRINERDGKAYLIDVGARSGGNYTPFVIQYATGFNFVEAMLDYSMEAKDTNQNPRKYGCFSYLVMHSKEAGVLKDIFIDDQLVPHIVERHDYISKGDSVRSFRGANAAVGIIITKFETMDEMLEVSDNLNKYITVIVQ